MCNDKLNPISEAKADGFEMRYYGIYNGSVAVLMSNMLLIHFMDTISKEGWNGQK